MLCSSLHVQLTLADHTSCRIGNALKIARNVAEKSAAAGAKPDSPGATQADAAGTKAENAAGATPEDPYVPTSPE